MAHFGNYNPESFGWNIPSHYVDFFYKGVNFPQGVASVNVRKLFTMFLDELVPHIPGGLHEGWCWGAENRVIAGTSTKSFHAYGLALDINAPVNYGKRAWKALDYYIPRNAGEIARPFGIEYGGDWSPASVDPMHFGIHLSPDEVAEIVNDKDDKHKPKPTHSYSPYQHIRPALRTIQRWSAGDDVKSLQDVLNKWYPSHKQLVRDGLFGPNTESFVKYYQRRAKLAVDGICGRHTWSGLGYNVRY